MRRRIKPSKITTLSSYEIHSGDEDSVDPQITRASLDWTDD